MTKMREQEPVDRYKVVWLIFLVLGLGTLLPWNFFMNAIQYFKFRLRDVDAAAQGLVPNSSSETNVSLIHVETRLQGMFSNFMTLCAMLPMLVFSCLNSILLPRIPQALRISGCLIAIFILFLLTAILVKISIEPLPFFIITMATIVLTNCRLGAGSVVRFGAVLQGSLFGLAGLLPITYTTPIMSGQGLAGTFAALAMICAITSGAEQSPIAFGYFNSACVVLVLAIVSYHSLPRLVSGPRPPSPCTGPPILVPLSRTPILTSQSPSPAPSSQTPPPHSLILDPHHGPTVHTCHGPSITDPCFFVPNPCPRSLFPHQHTPVSYIPEPQSWSTSPPPRTPVVVLLAVVSYNSLTHLVRGSQHHPYDHSPLFIPPPSTPLRVVV
ncbi:equilibrative nucleoside transporter 1-like, partial [Narcine bancroftii]|uniref:equilibrative nucleoside transporter 1-like n=1 Tax=Narcine bancroftii TaxID=1343680 RepID=UPI003831A04F